MQSHQPDDSPLSVFFFGAIVNILANIDTGSFSEYTLKAIVGGMVWLIFKVVADLISHKMTNVKPPKSKDDE